MAKKKVLIIDDSALVRKSLSGLIQSIPDFEIMATAADPYFAAKILKKQIPDVITLDVEMPRMDGITFLRTLMSQYPIPVVIISSLTKKGSETAIQALKFGAVEVISKPNIHGVGLEIEENRIRIMEAIKAASMASAKRRSAFQKVPSNVSSFKPLKSPDKGREGTSLLRTTEKIVVVGASTGGTEALRTILSKLPMDSPATAVVQHMPEKFTHYFASSLNEHCLVNVKEAVDGDSLITGTVLIAPGNKHMCVRRSGARYYVSLIEGPFVNRHRPSVDVLFHSVANYAGNNSTGILLTGMGSDGAKGLLEMKKAGATTVAQDEESSVVFGMPKEAIGLGAVDKVVGLEDIHKHIC
ncbi:MAG: chemotaxis response regulator protein-glutamate methylesterase [Cytophagales bacterium]|nr:chemotaxis response regulator protein-glutamate methylesterase [Cytophagales bacterium]